MLNTIVSPFPYFIHLHVWLKEIFKDGIDRQNQELQDSNSFHWNN